MTDLAVSDSEAHPVLDLESTAPHFEAHPVLDLESTALDFATHPVLDMESTVSHFEAQTWETSQTAGQSN